MITLLVAFCLLRQEDPVESLIRKLGSENFQEREKATAELKRRSEALMESLQKAERESQDPAEKARLRRALEEILGYRPLTMERIRAARVTCALTQTKVRAAAAELARLSGIPVEVDAPAEADPVIPELKGKDASLESLLDSLARQALGIWVVDGKRALLVLQGKVALRLFDVRDLTMEIGDEPRIPLEPDDSDVAIAVEAGTEAFPILTGEDLANLIKADLSPKNWEEADGKSIQYMNGLLIVRNDQDILRRVEPQLERYRRKVLTEVKIEIEAYAVKSGANVEEASIDKLREDAQEGKTARRVAAFDRTVRDKRQIALSSLTRTVLVTSHDANGSPVTTPYSTGTKINLRTSLDNERTSLRIDLEGGWSRVLSVEKRKEAAGEVQVPTCANHVLRLSLGAPVGRFAVLGRIGETRIVDGLGDIVVVGRFTAVERARDK